MSYQYDLRVTLGLWAKLYTQRNHQLRYLTHAQMCLEAEVGMVNLFFVELLRPMS